MPYPSRIEIDEKAEKLCKAEKRDWLALSDAEREPYRAQAELLLTGGKRKR